MLRMHEAHARLDVTSLGGHVTVHLIRPAVGRGDLQYRVRLSEAAGTDEPAIVLIHGIGVSHRYFSRLYRHLARTRTVACIDLPGFGGVSKPGSDPDIVAMAAGIGEVIDALGLDRVVLVGQSMGSQWAVETALQRPELVSLAVAIGPVADVAHRTALDQMRALALDTLGEPPWINAVVLVEYVLCGIPWYLTQLRHMLRYPLEDKVADLPMPLLVIQGSADPIAGLRWCRLLRDSARSANLAIVPGHHHLVQQSAPRAVASAICAHEPGSTR